MKILYWVLGILGASLLVFLAWMGWASKGSVSTPQVVQVAQKEVTPPTVAQLASTFTPINLIANQASIAHSLMAKSA